MVEHNPLETVVAQLLQALHTQTVTLTDTSRLVSGIGDSLKVALDKLDRLEDQATRLDEKAGRMDATHFTNTDDIARQVAEIRVEIVEIKELFFSIEATLQGLPSDSDIAVCVANKIKDSLTSIPTLPQIKQTLEDVMQLVCADCDKRREERHKLMTSVFDKIINFFGLLAKNKLLAFIVFIFFLIVLLVVCRALDIDPIGFFHSMWGKKL